MTNSDESAVVSHHVVLCTPTLITKGYNVPHVMNVEDLIDAIDVEGGKEMKHDDDEKFLLIYDGYEYSAHETSIDKYRVGAFWRDDSHKARNEAAPDTGDQRTDLKYLFALELARDDLVEPSPQDVVNAVSSA